MLSNYNNSFVEITKSLNEIQNITGVSNSDRLALASIEKRINEKSNELNGINGMQKVSDNQLNNFANYVQQDMEQADQWVTVSITTLILIAILLILLVK